jgi:mannose-6-phosphate isomerase-like protein (cupin superfamily)
MDVKQSSAGSKKVHQLRFGKGFRVIVSNRRAQLAQMVIDPGDGEGDPLNKHKGADQWLFVVAGHGKAWINEQEFALRPGSLVLIERGDRHEIRNTGRATLKTINFYAPPAYTASGKTKAAGKRG